VRGARARTDRMRPTLRPAGCALVVSAVAWAGNPAPARADEYSLHTLLAGQTAATTNAFSESDSDGDVAINYQVRPGILFSYHSHKALHELSAELGFDGYDFNDNITFTYRGGWRMTYSLSPRAELGLGAGGNGGRVDALSTILPANQGTPGVLPTGATDFYGADAEQTLSYELTPLWSMRENAFGRYLLTDAAGSDTRSLDAGMGLGLDRRFRVTSAGLNLQGSFQRLGTRPSGGMYDDHDQIDARATVRVRRDFSDRWSGAVEGGMVSLIPLEQDDELFYQPIGSLEVAHFPRWGSAQLLIAHRVAPNLFLAQTEVSDSVTVNAAVPLPWLARSRFDPKLSALGSIGFSHTRFKDLEDASDLASFNVLYSDLAVQYTPEENLIFAVRYQFVRQSDSDAVDPMLQALDYQRHTLMFTFQGRWPGRVAAEMPARDRIRVRDPLSEGDMFGAGGTGIRR
jgi:hypothetical protein